MIDKKIRIVLVGVAGLLTFGTGGALAQMGSYQPANLTVANEEWLPLATEVTMCFGGTKTTVDGNARCAFPGVTHLAVKSTRNAYMLYGKIITVTREGKSVLRVLRERYGPETTINHRPQLTDAYRRRWGLSSRSHEDCSRYRWVLSTVSFDALWCASKTITTMEKKYPKSTYTTPYHTPPKSKPSKSKSKPKQQGVPRRED